MKTPSKEVADAMMNNEMAQSVFLRKIADRYDKSKRMPDYMEKNPYAVMMYETLVKVKLSTTT